MKLAIISHTQHFLDDEQNIVGWGPTISEINHLAEDYEKIYHLAFLHPDEAQKSSIAYEAKNIEFLALPVAGGKSISDKLSILKQMPKTIRIINSVLDKVDAFQFRTPIGFGVYLVPYLTYFTTKKGWYKYAGNWNQKDASVGYKLQRFFLRNQKRKVTINGQWPDQPSNSLTFENPCLTLDERKMGQNIIAQKKYEPPFHFCFIGRLEDAKGVQRIIDAIDAFENKEMIGSINLIGDGDKRENYEKQVSDKALPIKFHGFLPRHEVFEIYKKSHFLLLPSTASEGFPKVIAEGMNFGCIPIVSDVSSIGQYINSSNGYIVSPTTSEKLHQILVELEETAHEELMQKSNVGYQTSENFTFEHYRNRIKKEILGIEE